MKSLKSTNNLNKKAISPLVSTIAMLGFAIILGIIVMGWGSEVEQKTQSSCSKARIEPVFIDNEPIICYTNKNIEFMLENIGSIDINGLKLNIIGESDISRVELEQSIQVGDVIKKVVPYDQSTIGTIKLLKFFALINKNYCGDSLIELENIEPCN
ncbi:MAG: hypothetical protein QF506_01435 [Candidatus Woesearchaeota archaeon]|jgi:hypothetical protein|nr:hypothetical protein [Candidatus Woesearchaeota archaeon]|tara:strand:- start:345 stop:812 length:468 start_codon:yes stop_codon:yes gene_type:complete